MSGVDANMSVVGSNTRKSTRARRSLLQGQVSTRVATRRRSNNSSTLTDSVHSTATKVAPKYAILKSEEIELAKVIACTPLLPNRQVDWVKVRQKVHSTRLAKTMDEKSDLRSYKKSPIDVLVKYDHRKQFRALVRDLSAEHATTIPLKDSFETVLDDEKSENSACEVVEDGFDDTLEPITAVEAELGRFLNDAPVDLSGKREVDWEAIQQKASPKLSSLIERKKHFITFEKTPLACLVKAKNRKSFRAYVADLARGRTSNVRILEEDSDSDDDEKLSKSEEELAALILEAPMLDDGKYDWDILKSKASKRLRNLIEQKSNYATFQKHPLELLVKYTRRKLFKRYRDSLAGHKKAPMVKKTRLSRGGSTPGKCNIGTYAEIEMREPESDSELSPPEDPKSILSAEELELAKLVTEIPRLAQGGFDWLAIKGRASQGLLSIIKQKEHFATFKNSPLHVLVKYNRRLVFKRYFNKLTEARGDLPQPLSAKVKRPFHPAKRSKPEADAGVARDVPSKPPEPSFSVEELELARLMISTARLKGGRHDLDEIYRKASSPLKAVMDAKKRLPSYRGNPIDVLVKSTRRGGFRAHMQSISGTPPSPRIKISKPKVAQAQKETKGSVAPTIGAKRSSRVAATAFDTGNLTPMEIELASLLAKTPLLNSERYDWESVRSKAGVSLSSKIGLAMSKRTFVTQPLQFLVTDTNMKTFHAFLSYLSGKPIAKGHELDRNAAQLSKAEKQLAELYVMNGTLPDGAYNWVLIRRQANPELAQLLDIKRPLSGFHKSPTNYLVKYNRLQFFNAYVAKLQKDKEGSKNTNKRQNAKEEPEKGFAAKRESPVAKRPRICFMDADEVDGLGPVELELGWLIEMNRGKAGNGTGAGKIDWKAVETQASSALKTRFAEKRELRSFAKFPVHVMVGDPLKKAFQKYRERIRSEELVVSDHVEISKDAETNPALGKQTPLPPLFRPPPPDEFMSRKQQKSDIVLTNVENELAWLLETTPKLVHGKIHWDEIESRAGPVLTDRIRRKRQNPSWEKDAVSALMPYKMKVPFRLRREIIREHLLDSGFIPGESDGIPAAPPNEKSPQQQPVSKGDAIVPSVPRPSKTPVQKQARRRMLAAKQRAHRSSVMAPAGPKYRKILGFLPRSSVYDATGFESDNEGRPSTFPSNIALVRARSPQSIRNNRIMRELKWFHRAEEAAMQQHIAVCERSAGDPTTLMNNIRQSTSQQSARMSAFIRDMEQKLKKL